MATIPRIYAVAVQPGSTRAVLSWSVSPVLIGQVCTVEVSTGAALLTSTTSYSVISDVDPTTAGRDLSSRTGSIISGHRTWFPIGQNSALSASTTYFYRVTCGPHFATGTFTTRPAGSGSTVTFKYASSRAGEYSANADMSSPTAISSAATHTVPVSAGSITYYRQTGGAIQALTAP